MKFSVEFERNGLSLRGFINVPHLEHGPYPTLIFFHGFTGQSSEAHFLFSQLAQSLESEGFCIIRFDFTHSGESDGTFELMTPTTEIEDSEAIINFAKQQTFVDSTRIGLLGFSYGGFIASITAGKFANNIKALALWSPVGNLEQFLEPYFKDVLRDVADIGGLLLSKRAFEDAKRYDIGEHAQEYEGPVLLVRADDDEVVPPESTLRFWEIYSDRLEILRLSASGHTFADVAVRKQLFKATSEFFKRCFSL